MNFSPGGRAATGGGYNKSWVDSCPTHGRAGLLPLWTRSPASCRNNTLEPGVCRSGRPVLPVPLEVGGGVREVPHGAKRKSTPGPGCLNHTRKPHGHLVNRRHHRDSTTPDVFRGLGSGEVGQTGPSGTNYGDRKRLETGRECQRGGSVEEGVLHERLRRTRC